MVDYANIFKQFNQQPRNLLEAVEANRLKNQQEQARQLALRQQQNQTSFEEQSNPLKLAKLQFNNMSEQDKFVETELLQGSIELQPFLDAKDSQSVMQSLQMRRNKLAQAGLRTDEIDNAIQLAQQGNFDALKQLTQSQIKAGRMIGLLDDNTQNLPAGIQYADALAQARASGDKQRVRDILTMTKAERLPTGVTYNPDGTVSNIGGVEDALGGQESAKKYAGSQAVLPAKQQEQVMRVDAEQEINKNKEESEINKENRGTAQKDKDNLFKIEQEISTLIQDIDRLLLDKSLDDVVGGFDAITPDLRSGSRRASNLIEKIKSSAVLDKASKLSGTVSDADMAILKQSANDLDRSLNEEDFRDNAIRFKNTLSTTLKNARDKTQNSNEKPTQLMRQPKKRFKFNVETGELE